MKRKVNIHWLGTIFRAQRPAHQELRKHFPLGTTYDWPIKTDETDHFDIVCPKCGNTAVVERVESFVLSLEKKLTIRFWLWCRKCGTHGNRKIYVEYPEEDVELHYCKGVKK